MAKIDEILAAPRVITWLETMAPEAIVGYVHLPCDCALATYLKQHCRFESASIDQRYTTVYTRGKMYQRRTPKWAADYIGVHDALGTTGTPVIAADALAALRKLIGAPT